MISKKNFHIEHIAVFSDEYKMLNSGDKCYFLVSNDCDYHIKMLFYGEIVFEKWSSGMTKTFIIKPLDCISTQEIQEKYLFRKPFTILKNPGNLYIRQTFNPFTSADPSKWVDVFFKVNSFFVREYSQKGLDSIKQLMADYKEFTIKDLQSRINDLK